MKSKNLEISFGDKVVYINRRNEKIIGTFSDVSIDAYNGITYYLLLVTSDVDGKEHLIKVNSQKCYPLKTKFADLGIDKLKNVAK